MATNPPATRNTPDPRDDAFIREVDDEVRRDEAKRLFQTYGRWALAAIIVALAALGAWLFWQNRQAERREAAGEALLKGIDQLNAGSSPEGLATVQPLAENNGAGYRALSLLTQAGVAARGGDAPKALGLYNSVAADAGLPAPLRDLAAIKAVRLEFDRLPPNTVVQRLAPYAVAGGPWFGVAGEMTALAHLKAGRREQAGPLFLRIAADESQPQSLRARAEQMAASLGQDTSVLAKAPVGAGQ